jgi:hypothetical protein
VPPVAGALAPGLPPGAADGVAEASGVGGAALGEGTGLGFALEGSGEGVARLRPAVAGGVTTTPGPCGENAPAR